jgi:predicted phosphodiesterase
MLKSEKAKEWRSKFPDVPTLALARRMYAKNKLLFKDVEDARSRLRYIEGKQGAVHRVKVNHLETFKDEHRPFNPYKLPESDETDFKPYQIKGHKKIAIFSDIHVPYHNIPSLTAAIDFCKKEKPDALLLNGDTIDCHKLSRFTKDPSKRNFKQELDVFKAIFNVFKKELNCKIYFKIGNHEERYEHFLQEKAGELDGVEEFKFENILKARAEGIEIIGDKRPMQIGSLWGIHGHEYVGGITAPVNPARGLFNRGKVTCFQGHNHQTSEHTEPTLSGKMITTWSIGCLSELHPAYMPLNKWNHGFAMVEVDGKEFQFRNKRIFNGKIL